jgi:hypothetical protein
MPRAALKGLAAWAARLPQKPECIQQLLSARRVQSLKSPISLHLGQHERDGRARRWIS